MAASVSPVRVLWLGWEPGTQWQGEQRLPRGTLFGLLSLELKCPSAEVSISDFGLPSSSFSETGVLLPLPHPYPHREQEV